MKKNLFLLLFLIYFLPFTVKANVEITEIMYDLTNPEGDTDREWVELHNTGTNEVDLSKWNFYDTSHHSFHPVGASSLPADGYAVVVQDVTKFKIDWPNFSGLIFTANFPSLGNEGDTLKLKDNNDKNGVVADQVTYTSSMGGGGDGNSLQKLNSNFVSASPTPGAQNIGTSNSSSNTSSSISTSSTNTIIKPKEVVIPKITSEIIMKTTGTVEIPFLINSSILGYSKEPMTYGKVFWNFGDGSTREKLIPEENFYHTYKYPGDYIVTLSYFDNFYTKEPKATDRVVVSVFSPSIVISSIGKEDPYIEFENKADREVDLSSWVIKGIDHEFVVPIGTTILSKKKLIFGPAITGFSTAGTMSIKLFSSGGSLVSSYPFDEQTLLKVNSGGNVSPKVSYGNFNKIPSNKDVIDLSELSQTASSVNSGFNYKYSLFFGLGGIILVGIIAIFFIKNRKLTNSDVEIEKELTAGDIKILE